jgi:hypothetical protein
VQELSGKSGFPPSLGLKVEVRVVRIKDAQNIMILFENT